MSRKLDPPIFIISTKAYLWGEKALKLARIADRIAREYDVCFIMIPQLVDLRMIAESVDIPVYAPNMDPIRPGRGHGHDLPEALKEAGAAGVMINHSERPKTLSEIDGCIRRAREIGLRIIVCCDSPSAAEALASLEPDAILPEPPRLIGTKKPVSVEMKQFVIDSVKAVKSRSRKILLLVGAGISRGSDVAEAIRLGADGAGASRAICESSNPEELLREIAEAMRKAWDSRREEEWRGGGPGGI